MADNGSFSAEMQPDCTNADPSKLPNEQSGSQDPITSINTASHETRPESEDHKSVEEPVEGHDEATRLKQLAATVRDQDDLEKDVGRQADQMLLEQADERDLKRIERTEKEKKYVSVLIFL